MKEKAADILALDLAGALVRPSSRPARLEREITEIFTRLRMPVYRYVLSIVADPAEAEDVAQEAFLRLYTVVRGGGRVENVPAWVFRTAHNLAVDRVRTLERRHACDIESLDELTETGGEAASVETDLAEKERREAVRSALAALSPQERRCVDLRSEGLRYREIADVLGVSLSTVQTFLTRALRKLIKEINA